MSGFSETERAFFRGSLLEAFERKSVTTAIEVDRRGRLRCVSSDWDEYWQYIPESAQKELHQLETCWRSYISSRFCAENEVSYCRAYYMLLDKIMGQANASALKISS